MSLSLQQDANNRRTEGAHALMVTQTHVLSRNSLNLCGPDDYNTILLAVCE